MAKYARKLPGSGAVASIGYEPPDPAKPDPLWSAAERYTGPLDAGARAKLGHIVWTYAVRLEAENNAEPVANAEAWLGKARGGARKLIDLLSTSTAEAGHYSTHLIDQALGQNHRYFVRDRAESDLEQPPSVAKLRSLMFAFIAACNSAAKTVAKHRDAKHWRPGLAWDTFVLHLADFFRQCDKVDSAPKEGDSSQFVCFVHAMQHELPHDFWRHPGAPIARAARLNRRKAETPSSELNRAVAEALRGRAALQGMTPRPRRKAAGNKRARRRRK